MPNTTTERISLSEIVTTIRPLMSKSTFYGTKQNPGPRWTEVAKLDIRSGRHGITADRQRFTRWYRELQGQLATAAHPKSARLGDRARSSADTFREELVLLCAGLAAGRITEDDFDRAVVTLRSS